ncbi:MAG: hypothetical protein U1E42_08385 [Rhodospirillales bacterium]
MKTEEDLRASVQDRGLRLLALNIIRQALDDLVADTPASANLYEHERVREDARRFLFGSSNGWKGSRAFWASIIGTSEEEITRAAQAKLQAPPKAFVKPQKKKPLPSVEELVSLGPTLRLSEIAERFGLDDEGSAYSSVAKLRENGFKVTLTGGRKSGVYVVTPRE